MNEDALSNLRNSFPELVNTVIGDPISVLNLLHEEQYIIVPFLLDTKIRGIAILDLNGKVLSHGVLMPHIKNEKLLVDKSFFDAVPSSILEDIMLQYKDLEIVEPPFLTYDISPRKWGWLLKIIRANTPQINIFIGPQGWYQQNNSPLLE